MLEKLHRHRQCVNWQVKHTKELIGFEKRSYIYREFDLQEFGG